MDTVHDILDLAGGDVAVIALCAVSAEALKKWKQNGKIPSKHWPDLVNASNGAITYERLTKTVARPRQPRRRAA